MTAISLRRAWQRGLFITRRLFSNFTDDVTEDILADLIGGGDDYTSTGKVLKANKCAASFIGLTSCSFGNVVSFSEKAAGVVFSLESSITTAGLLSNFTSPGATVELLQTELKIPVGKSSQGSVMNSVGQVVKGFEHLKCPQTDDLHPILNVKPLSIIYHESPKKWLETGNQIIDALFTIGYGQKVNFFGENEAEMALTAENILINQAKKGNHVVYVSIGQSEANLAKVIASFQAAGVFDKCTVVAATQYSSPTMKFLAPFAGCAIGEHTMKNGEHAIIVYDNISRFAAAFGQLSKEFHSFPSIQNSLGGILDRTDALSPLKGGGSMTAITISDSSTMNQFGDMFDFSVPFLKKTNKFDNYSTIDWFDQGILTNSSIVCLPQIHRQLIQKFRQQIYEARELKNHISEAAKFSILLENEIGDGITVQVNAIKHLHQFFSPSKKFPSGIYELFISLVLVTDPSIMRSEQLNFPNLMSDLISSLKKSGEETKIRHILETDTIGQSYSAIESVRNQVAILEQKAKTNSLHK